MPNLELLTAKFIGANDDKICDICVSPWIREVALASCSFWGFDIVTIKYSRELDELECEEEELVIVKYSEELNEPKCEKELEASLLDAWEHLGIQCFAAELILAALLFPIG